MYSWLHEYIYIARRGKSSFSLRKVAIVIYAQGLVSTSNLVHGSKNGSLFSKIGSKHETYLNRESVKHYVTSTFIVTCYKCSYFGQSDASDNPFISVSGITLSSVFVFSRDKCS